MLSTGKVADAMHKPCMGKAERNEAQHA